MSRGAMYLGLLANLRHEELIAEARRQRWTEPIPPRRHRSRSVSDTVLRALRIKR